jgi:hypothetical protein
VSRKQLPRKPCSLITWATRYCNQSILSLNNERDLSDVLEGPLK